MSELNLQADQTTAIDTNAEYILPDAEKKHQPVLLSVSRAIIVETLKDFFGSIIGFFLRYIKHFVRCLVYFVNPSLQKKPLKDLDFKQNSQHAFEFVIIVLAILIFMIKLGWIPETSKDLVEIYSNDLVQKIFELLIFFLFAVYFIVFSAFSLLIGRFLRLLFKINMPRNESDILYVYLNNAFFSISAIIALIIRCSASLETHDEKSITEVLSMIIIPTVFFPLVIWSVRFAMLHQMKLMKGVVFFLTSVVLFTIFYFLTSLIVCLAIVGA
jgi:hypothetical protein